jgi:hypothetical protein
MKKINIRKFYYHLRHRYLTMNNVVVTIALLIGAAWAWGSVGMMQRNYALQKEVDSRHRTARLADLEVKNLQFEQKYYQTREYQELVVRERMGLAASGEKVLFLPANSQAAINVDKAALATSRTAASPTEPPNNMTQWMNFLFGGNRSD